MIFGLVVITLLKVIYTMPSGCLYDENSGKNIIIKGVVCDGALLNGIPQDLRKDINYLEIKDDAIATIITASFSKYPNIKYLKLRNLGIYTIEEDAFSRLEHLILLDLSLNPIATLPAIPPSLESLFLNRMHRSEIFTSNASASRITRLPSLKKLVIKGNGFVRLPDFVKNLKSIKEMDVSDNNIGELAVADLSPLCNVEEISFTRNSISGKEKAACNCMGIEKWGMKRHVRLANLTCPPFAATVLDRNKCEKKIEEEVESADWNCRMQIVWKSAILIGIGVAALLAAVFIWCTWTRFCRRKAPFRRIPTIPEVPRHSNNLNGEGTPI